MNAPSLLLWAYPREAVIIHEIGVLGSIDGDVLIREYICTGFAIVQISSTTTREISMKVAILNRRLRLATIFGLLVLLAGSSNTHAQLTAAAVRATSDQTIPAFTKRAPADITVRTAPTPRPTPMPASTWESKPIGGRNYYGFEGGVTYNWFQGAKNFGYSVNVLAKDNPTTNADIVQNVEFATPGSGIGFLIGGVLDLALTNSVALQGKLRYVENSRTGDDTRDVLVNGQATELARVVGHHKTTLSYVGLDALARVQLEPNSVYLLAGIGFSAIVADNQTITYAIDSSGAGVSFNDVNGAQTGRTSLSASGAIPGLYNATRLSGKLGIGTFIPIGTSGMVLTPELLADIGLSELYSPGSVDQYTAAGRTAPKLWHIDLSIGVKWPWGSSTETSSADEEDRPTSTTPPTADQGVHLKGSVHDQKTGKPVDANMTVIDLSDNSVAATGHTDEGNYDLKVKGPGKYSVTADADGYLFGSSYFEVDANGRILKGRHDLALSPTSNGRVRLLVFFDFGKDYLQPASYPELDRAVRLMKANPSMEVEIAGYTDSKGSEAYNQDLSVRRSNAVRNYLVKKGIEENRLTAQGYGMKDPVATNDTEEGRAENRRVEFVVTHK
jgi:hypothetical protein